MAKRVVVCLVLKRDTGLMKNKIIIFYTAVSSGLLLFFFFLHQYDVDYLVF